MGLLLSVMIVAVSGWLLVRAWGELAAAPKAVPAEAPSPEALRAAKLRFIMAMNRRIGREPQAALPLQTLRDMVVGWYDLKGAVVGVSFVARSCCDACYKLDGQPISLLDVDYLSRHVPPIHVERGRQLDCGCTLRPLTAGGRVSANARGAAKPLLR